MLFRSKILEDITKWANDCSLASPRVFWLTGHASSGKITIAYTIANQFEEDGKVNEHTVLGGNFLCSQKHKLRPVYFPPSPTSLLLNANRMQTPCMLPTSSYALSNKPSFHDKNIMPENSYRQAISFATGCPEWDAVNYDVATQMKDLVGPWQQSEATRPPSWS